MSLETDIVALLGPLVGGRCYSDESPDGAALPFIVYQGVGGQVVEFMEQAIGSEENIRLQVVVWSRTRLEANAIIRQARAAIIGSTMQVSTLGAAAWLSNEPLKLRGARQDFSIWYTP